MSLQDILNLGNKILLKVLIKSEIIFQPINQFDFLNITFQKMIDKGVQ